MINYDVLRYKFLPLLFIITWLLQLGFTGLNMPMLLISSAMLMLTLFVALMTTPVTNPFVGRYYLPWFMLLMLLWLVLSPGFSAAPYRSWLYSWVWLALPIVFFITVQAQKYDIHKLSLLLPFAGSLLSLISIYQFHMMSEQYAYRASGTLLDPNSYAGLLNLLLLPLVGLLMQQKQSAHSLLEKLQWLAIVLMAGGVCSTGSRAGIMIMFIGIILLMLIAWRRGGRSRIGLLILGVCLLWLVESMLIADTGLRERLASVSLHDPSLSSRFLIWDSAWQLVKDAAWWGTGLGTFALLYHKTRSVEESETYGGYVHSDPLQLLLEGGWPLLILVSAVVVYAAVYLIKLLRAKGDIDLSLIALALSILLAAAHACVNFNFYNVSILSVVALYLAIIYLHVNRGELVVVHNSGVKHAVSVVVSLLLICSVTLLFMDYRAAELQKPLMSKGLQAGFTEAQCDEAGLLSSFRPSMPGLAMIEGVCALKKNNCDAVNEAVVLFDRAIDASPLQAELYAFVAQLKLMAGQCLSQANSDARSYLIQSLQKNPGFFPSRYLLYNMDKQAGRVEEAKKWLTDGLKYGMDYKQRDRYKVIIKGFQ